MAATACVPCGPEYNPCPVDQNASLVSQNATPVGQNTKPVGQNTTPVGQNTTPVGQNITPRRLWASLVSFIFTPNQLYTSIGLFYIIKRTNCKVDEFRKEI